MGHQHQTRNTHDYHRAADSYKQPSSPSPFHLLTPSPFHLLTLSPLKSVPCTHSHRHDMNCRHMILSYILHRLAPVEHRREFDHHALGFFQQFIDDFEHIGGAVGNAVGTPPMFIATGWIDEDQVSRMPSCADTQPHCHSPPLSAGVPEDGNSPMKWRITLVGVPRRQPFGSPWR